MLLVGDEPRLSLNTAQDAMVDAAAEARPVSIADAERHRGGFAQVQRELRFRVAGVGQHVTLDCKNRLQQPASTFVVPLSGRDRFASPPATLCAFSVFTARLCEATSRSGTTRAAIKRAPRRRMAARRCRRFGIEKPTVGAATA